MFSYVVDVSALGADEPQTQFSGSPAREEREGPCEPLWGVVSHQVRHRGGVAGHHAGLHAGQEVRARVGAGQQRRGGGALRQQLRRLLLHQLLHALRLSGEPGGARGLGWPTRSPGPAAPCVSAAHARGCPIGEAGLEGCVPGTAQPHWREGAELAQSELSQHPSRPFSALVVVASSPGQEAP